MVNDQANFAVIDEETVAGLGIGGKPFVRGGDTVMGAFAVFHCDGDGFAGGPDGAVVLEPAQTNLGALQVRKHAYGFAASLGGFTHPLVVLGVVGMIAVGHVHAGDIHAGIYKFADSFGRRDSRT